MHNKKVMFIYGHPAPPMSDRRIRYHLGVAQLSAELKQIGIVPRLFFIPDWHPNEQKRFLAVLEEERIEYCMFSVVCIDALPHTIPYMELARDKGRTVVLGGPHLRGGKTIAKTPAHFICRGDGDTLPEFFLKGNTTLFEQRLITQDIHNLPLPDYDMILPYLPTHRIGDDPETFLIPYLSSRDCPWNCTFCADSIIPEKMTRIRARVKEDHIFLKERYRERMTNTYFTEGTMPYYSKEWRESWEGISFPFSGQIRADIDRDLLRWLRNRGLENAFLGIEDADESTRNNIFNKQLPDRDIYRTIRTLRNWNIYIELSFIYGAPGQAPDAKKKAIAMIENIIKTKLYTDNGTNYWAYGISVYLNKYYDYTKALHNNLSI